MNDSSPGSHESTKTRRHLLLVLAAVVFAIGCGQTKPHVSIPFTVPDTFSDEAGIWERVESEPSASDNQQIGKFFEKHSDLVGSPDWTGQPDKYVSKKLSSRKRFYWFSGNSENPSWNAIEVNGSAIRQLAGTGSPGTEIQE